MSTPLADRIRPRTLGEISGQRHLFSEGAVLRNIIESGNIPNLIFYGPSGTGKTTVARIIAAATKKRLHILNCTSASLSDVKEVIGEINTIAAPNGLLLYLDEIQYFNKKPILNSYIKDIVTVFILFFILLHSITQHFT